jgi:hypothetical protein
VREHVVPVFKEIYLAEDSVVILLPTQLKIPSSSMTMEKSHDERP